MRSRELTGRPIMVREPTSLCGIVSGAHGSHKLLETQHLPSILPICMQEIEMQFGGAAGSTGSPESG